MMRFFLFVGIFVCEVATAEPLGSLVALKGDVFVKLGGKKVKAVQGHSIENGAIVSTGNKSFALIELNSGDKLKLGGRSRMRIQPPRGVSGLELAIGSVVALVKKDSAHKGQFKVKTKSAVAGVRGTQFFASYGTKGKADDIWLCVNQGEVEVQSTENKDQRVLVKAGEGISVRKDQGVSQPKPLAWTKNLNWEMDPSSSNLENTVNIEDAYSDVLDEDYD